MIHDRFGKAVVGGLWLASALAATPPAAAQDGSREITVTARKIASFDITSGNTTFGDLEFLGGLELNAEDEDFGSFSGLDFAPDGRLYAVTDRGILLNARLETEAGAPVGLTDASLSHMRDPAGNLPDAKVNADAEGLRITNRQGRLTALVSYEQVHEVRAFAMPFDPAASPRAVPLPGFVRGLRRNAGLESIAVAPDGSPLAGALVVIAEKSLDKGGNHRAFIVGGAKPGAFAIGRTGDYDITDAAFLPDGDLIVMERRFSFTGGIGLRLRRLNADQIRPGRILDGSVLVDAGLGFQIDNMEGLAVTTDETGGTVLTLISDDNHNLLQRTLLLRFALAKPKPPMPRLRPKQDATQ